MSVSLTFLTEEEYPKIYRTFLDSFADYQVDMSYLTEESLLKRCLKNGLVFERSVGAFAGKRMVGFNLVAIDTWKGVLSALDAGTGIVPEYRGKGLARQMFDFALPPLRDLGVKQYVLETLRDNIPAFKAYERAGFRVTREEDVFDLEVKKAAFGTKSGMEVDINPMTEDILDQFIVHCDREPSWENSFASIKRIEDEIHFFGAFAGDQAVGLLVFYPLLSWIMSLVVKRDFRGKGIATQLMKFWFESFSARVAKVRVMNVDTASEALTAFIKRTGFKIHCRHYEMVCDL